MNLTDRANAIISQPALVDTDITELAKIKREMSKFYDDAVTIAWIQEQLYNQGRAEKYISYKKKAKDSGKKYTEAELDMIAKNYAEQKYWDWRTAKARATWLKAKMEAIKDICVNYYSQQKANIEASR